MQGPKRESPLNLLGERLRSLRETRRESLAEVSGAVEIDMEMLERIEGGDECPSEDILTLLINHFSLKEHEAVELWEWAGFDRSDDTRPDVLSDLASKATLVLIALDARVLYSDSASVLSGKNGIVLNFSQSALQPQQAPIARIGMSYEQAEEVLYLLQQSILRKKYLPQHPLLPPGEKPAA